MPAGMVRVGHCRQSLARCEVPREVYLERVLPKNAAGKIAKPVLRQRLRDASTRTRIEEDHMSISGQVDALQKRVAGLKDSAEQARKETSEQGNARIS